MLRNKLWLFEHDHVSCAFDPRQLGARNPIRQVFRILDRRHLIHCPADDERRRGDLPQALSNVKCIARSVIARHHFRQGFCQLRAAQFNHWLRRIRPQAN
jgi:hypothetical protein